MTHAEATKTFASERYLLGEMSASERDAFEAHFFSCNECADDMRIASRLRDGAKAGLGIHAPAVQRAAWRLPAFAPWALAAALAGIAAYQSILVVPELRRQNGPQALEPVALRPATRGADLTITVRPDRAVALAVDVNATDAVRELSYAVRDTQGATVAIGRAPMPPAGTPLLLMIPGGTFQSSGPHTLRLGDAASGSELGEYRFVIRR